MTRTERLGLCTWALTDDVDLSEINENFQILDGTVANFAAGSYTGVGGSGSAQYNEILFSFTPKVVFIFGGNRQCILYPSCGHGYSSGANATLLDAYMNGNTIHWYADSASAQMNTTGTTYAYVAIG